VLGVLGAAFSPAFWFLVVMRFVIGPAVGSASMAVPLYISEVAPPRVRGALVSFNQLALTGGILVSFLVDYALSSSADWRLMFGLATIPAALLFVGMLTQAESPVWLVTHGRIADARKVLARVRSADHDIEGEIDNIRSLSEPSASYRELLQPRVRKLVVVGVLLAVFQQITGINTVIYYAPTLLHQAGLGNSASLLANVGNGIVNVGMTVVAIRLIDKVGRRVLLVTGTVGMAIALFVVAATFALSGATLGHTASIVAVVSLAVYTGSFAIGLGPVFWLLISEIYPARIRGKAMSIATIANWGGELRRRRVLPHLAERHLECRDLLLDGVLEPGGCRVLLAEGAGDQGPHPRRDRAGDGLVRRREQSALNSRREQENDHLESQEEPDAAGGGDRDRHDGNGDGPPSPRLWNGRRRVVAPRCVVDAAGRAGRHRLREGRGRRQGRRRGDHHAADGRGDGRRHVRRGDPSRHATQVHLGPKGYPLRSTT
jgi:MFS family permease